MAQVKISELPTLAQQLQSANYIPLIHNGITYKYAPFNYVVKNSGDETIAGVKTFSSSPIVPAGDTTGEAVNYDQLTLVDQKHSVVDCTSRVAEYTGDGIPMIPDNVAGRTYFQDEWATTDGWSGTGASVSVANGRLVIAKTNASQFVKKTFGSDFNPQTCIIRVRVVSGSLFLNRVTMDFRNSSGTYLSSVIFTVPGDGRWVTVDKYYSNTSVREVWIYPGAYDNATQATIEIDFVYIGTGAYDTPALDRSGNGNSLTLNAVTPVNGKYGKEMSFNGSSSYARPANSSLLANGGTLAFRIAFNHFTNNPVMGWRQYGAAYISVSSSTNIRVKCATIIHNFAIPLMTAGKHYSFVIMFNKAESKIDLYKDGVFIKSDSETVFSELGLIDDFIGAADVTGDTTLEFLNGIISHFRYDSRIWTADEARAWSLNPSVEDSIAMSVTPSAGKAMVWKTGVINASVSTTDFTEASGAFTLTQINDVLYVRSSIVFSARTITAGDTLFTFTGLSVSSGKTVRCLVNVDTTAVRTTALFDINIASNGSGSVQIYPNGDRAFAAGTIDNAKGLYGDASVYIG